MNSYSVMLVEDDLLSTELAHRAAAESCHHIDLIVVEGCDAMLDWLSCGIANHERMPQIIVLDLTLPKLEGLAVLRKLRLHTATHHIPIVVFSAEYTQADVQMSYRAGANSFVFKPVDLAQFADFFHDQLAYWMQPRQRVAGRRAGR